MSIVRKALEYVGWRASPNSVPLFASRRSAVAAVVIVVAVALAFKAGEYLPW